MRMLRIRAAPVELTNRSFDQLGLSLDKKKKKNTLRLYPPLKKKKKKKKKKKS